MIKSDNFEKLLIIVVRFLQYVKVINIGHN